MKPDDFFRKVKDQAGLDSTEEGARLTEVVLTALAARIERGDRADLASELPGEFSRYFDSGREQELLPARDFVDLVSARYDGGIERTGELIRAVLGTLREAVSEGRVQQLMAELPEDYGPLFSNS